MNKYSIVIILMVLFFIAQLCYAQREGTDSPEVHADRTVTFRYIAPVTDDEHPAPEEKSVSIYTQFTEGVIPLTKGDEGVWSVTLGTAEPGIYVYGFVVDGLFLTT